MDNWLTFRYYLTYLKKAINIYFSKYVFWKRNNLKMAGWCSGTAVVSIKREDALIWYKVRVGLALMMPVEAQHGTVVVFHYTRVHLQFRWGLHINAVPKCHDAVSMKHKPLPVNSRCSNNAKKLIFNTCLLMICFQIQRISNLLFLPNTFFQKFTSPQLCLK